MWCLNYINEFFLHCLIGLTKTLSEFFLPRHDFITSCMDHFEVVLRSFAGLPNLTHLRQYFKKITYVNISNLIRKIFRCREISQLMMDPGFPFNFHLKVQFLSLGTHTLGWLPFFLLFHPFFLKACFIHSQECVC